MPVSCARCRAADYVYSRHTPQKGFKRAFCMECGHATFVQEKTM